MGARRRMRNPMAFAMHLRPSEVAAYEAALASVEENGGDDARAEATFVRQQLSLHASYVRVCDSIERFSDNMSRSRAHLVPLRFPVRLTPKTRECVEDGMFRSFVRFLEDLHLAVVAQHKDGVDDAVTDVNTFLTKLGNALTLESCRVLDGEVSAHDARNVCISYIEKCRLVAIRHESVELMRLDASCGVVLDCLKRFSKTVETGRRKSAVERMRSFLLGAERRGVCEAANRLRRVRQIRIVLDKHSWLYGGHFDHFDDERIQRVYDLLVVTQDELAQALMWQQRRIAYLGSANAANCCWCGVALTTDPDGALLQAPAHMRSLAGSERVRVVLKTEETPFACYLSVVGVANLVIDLLLERRLPLNRVSATYANRILTFDFCKYERAARNILEETVRPWHERQSACEFP